MSRFSLLVCLAGLVAAIGCGGDTPSSPSQQPPRGEYAEVDLRIGTGTVATSGRPTVVNYTGWLYDPSRPENKGDQFDTSAGRGALSVTPGGVIAGFERGIVGMRVGGLRRVTIPPELGYGSTARTGIPANSTLVFEIELLQVN
jgi:FKBP-type peptidyl-prolyl cis-trans isomerase FkpA